MCSPESPHTSSLTTAAGYMPGWGSVFQAPPQCRSLAALSVGGVGGGLGVGRRLALSGGCTCESQIRNSKHQIQIKSNGVPNSHKYSPSKIHQNTLKKFACSYKEVGYNKTLL